MGKQTWSEVLNVQRAAGTLFNTYTTAKSVINPQALNLIPGGYFEPEKIMEILVVGAISNIVTTPGTITFQVMMGTIVVFSFTIQLNATAHTTLPFWLQILMTCRSDGSGTSANFMGQALAFGKMFTNTAGQTDGANSDSIIMAPASAPAVGNGFDSTINNVLDFWAGFSINNAGNGIQIHQYVPKILN